MHNVQIYDFNHMSRGLARIIAERNFDRPGITTDCVKGLYSSTIPRFCKFKSNITSDWLNQMIFACQKLCYFKMCLNLEKSRGT